MELEQRIFIKIYYLADQYYGSQRQNIKQTIEGVVLDALKDKSYIKNVDESGFEAASRTDRFVSARGAVFSFITQKKFYPEELNSALPEDIGVWAHTMVPLEFKPRRNAICRHYKYILSYPVTCLQKKNGFDLSLIKEGCKLLEGKHNFINFAKKEKEKETIKDLDEVKFSIFNDYLVLDFYARSFLRQQIRKMIRKLVEFGSKKITLDEFKSLFNPMKSFSYKPYSPNGLILWDIIYPENIIFIENENGKERKDKFFYNKYLYSQFETNFFNILRERE
jgi:tRNA pseudouridine38-40 synthase